MVTGQARYLEDYTPPGALHLRLVRSELAHAEITEIDSSAWRTSTRTRPSSPATT